MIRTGLLIIAGTFSFFAAALVALTAFAVSVAVHYDSKLAIVGGIMVFGAPALVSACVALDAWRKRRW
jgi:hypothetical protein